MTVFLIRHGETEANAARVVQTPDVPLSERGLDQARKLGRRLAAEGVGAILSSDLRRAVMTAEAVRDATAAPLALDPLLQERNFGDVRGTPYAELAVDLFDPGFEPPGGESWDVFHARVARAWPAVLERALAANGPLAVVTHGLVCQSVITHHADLGEDVVPVGFGWANTSVSILEPAPGRWRVRLLNCTEHLLGESAVRGPV